MTDLLWTGGWDSTFRLLQLARAGAEIQPHYIRNQERSSLKKELQAMKEIRSKVIERFPEACVHEIEIFDRSEIIISEEFNQAHRNLSSKETLGTQYIYIASYSRQKNIKNMELSIERGVPGRPAILPCMENTETDQKGRRVMARSSDSDLQCLFGQFSFPILSMTKRDMLDYAKAYGLLDILNMTWFCHQPVFKKPCGTCVPCIATMEAGHKYRFSALPLARYRLAKIVAPYPNLHKFLKNTKSSVMSGVRQLLSRYPTLYLRIKNYLHGTNN